MNKPEKNGPNAQLWEELFGVLGNRRIWTYVWFLALLVGFAAIVLAPPDKKFTFTTGKALGTGGSSVLILCGVVIYASTRKGGRQYLFTPLPPETQKHGPVFRWFVRLAPLYLVLCAVKGRLTG